MLNIFYDSYNILNKVYSDGAYLKQAMLSVSIDEKNRSAVTKICYGVLERDIFLSYRIAYVCEKTPKLVVRTILKIAMYCITFLNKPVYAVTDTAVELLSRLGKKGVCGFVNAFLRKYPGVEFPDPVDKYERLSLTYDYPFFAVKKLIEDYGEEKAKAIMSAPAEPTCIRFVTRGREYLEERKLSYTALPYENAFYVEKFQRNADYDRGSYTFQSAGSMAICEVAGQGEELLDACAAPGGKSVLLSEKFKKVISQELHPHRANLISAYADRMHRKNICAIVGDATVYNPDFKERFDSVLCDVPCSGFGVVKTNPDIKLNKSGQSLKALNILQLNILKNCARYVKIGGELIYSTCSVFKCENDGIISSFLSAKKEFMPEIISVKIPYVSTDFGVQMLPDISCGAGFFVCRMRRKK